MTEMQKWKFRQHWDKWNIAYIFLGAMFVFVGLIGLEAKGIIQYRTEKYFLTFLVKTFIIYNNEINGKIKQILE